MRRSARFDRYDQELPALKSPGASCMVPEVGSIRP